MRLLADQDVYKVTIDALKLWGHDVVTVKELGMQGATDRDLLRKAKIDKRLVITRDKDFGTLVFWEKELSTGVVLLRITPMTTKEVHHEIQRLFEEHNEEELKGVFCVVEPHQHRIRHLR